LTCVQVSSIIYVYKKLKDKNMQYLDLAFLIVLVGCGYTSWLSGKKTGIQLTIDYLEEHGYIEFDDELENIS
tara:strand:+ start:234 stop:449 length:216 start_codon:yes stop_codon:yes gene_type:complete